MPSLTKNLRTSATVPKFQWSHLWEPAIVNPINLKSYTLPIFNLKDPYGRAFHLSWIGFFVAFLSWFAFPPFLPDAIKSDLNLTNAQIDNSNIVAFAATLIVRAMVGPLVDKYGPRKVMAGILAIGAIPSGLAGTAHNAGSLYALRFFIGILGASFVPCQAWTSAFFDKSCVGAANSLVGGWGNMGGGATFVIMASLLQNLTVTRGLAPHIAWRAAFVIVPVPILLFVAVMVLIFGQDHPAGRWADRNYLADAVTAQCIADIEQAKEDGPFEKKNKASSVHTMETEVGSMENKKAPGVQTMVTEVGSVESQGALSVQTMETEVESVDSQNTTIITSSVDVAVSQPLTGRALVSILGRPVTWMPAMGYLTTLGIELVMDSKMADVLFDIYHGKRPGFNQTTAGYYTSIFGFLNVVACPLGGFIGDKLYKRFGTKGKKIWSNLCGFCVGVTLLAGGLYLQKNLDRDAQLSVLMGVFSVSAIFAELGSGASLALVPHCNPSYNGFMSGLVGSCGNLGAIMFSLVFRFQTDSGKAFWIIGVVCMVVNLILLPIPVPNN